MIYAICCLAQVEWKGRESNTVHDFTGRDFTRLRSAQSPALITDSLKFHRHISDDSRFLLYSQCYPSIAIWID